MRRFTAMVLTLGLVGAACTGDGADETSTSAAVTSQPPATTAPPPTPSPTMSAAPSTSTPQVPLPDPPMALPAVLPAFADFPGIPLLDGPAYAGGTVPAAFDDVLVAPLISRELEEAQAAGRLLENGFVIVPGDTRLFHRAYDAAFYHGYPVYVTTDVGYHVWHLGFSKTVREIEEGALLPILDDFLAGALAASRDQAAELAGSPMEGDATRVVEWFQVASALAGHDVGGLSRRAAAELALAEAALEFTRSPLTSFDDTATPLASAAGLVDYSQMKPRGHYTRNEELRRYFRAMAFLGQSGFFIDQPQSLRLGVLVARIITQDSSLGALWRSIYEPTAFLVGTADDYTPFDVAAAVREVGGGFDAPATFASDDAVEQVADRLEATRPVLINPEGASMRTMGARFVIDSFVLDQLTFPSVRYKPDSEDRRVTPSGLDVAATFGSELARRIQIDRGEHEYENYLPQLDAMTELIAVRDIASWASTVYDAWLYAVEPMWAPHGEEFPDYMQTTAWAAKALQTGLGSYTELKHDTILYAKQGFAAQAGGSADPFVPRHWVEPDPVAFERLAAAAQLIRDGFADRDLLGSEQAELLDDIVAFEARLGRIARDELAGLPISEADGQFLRFIGGDIEALWLASSDIDAATGLPEPGDQDAALVADIFSSTFLVLEIGTGRIDTIYVLVPNDEGRFQIARGGVYSYYEFSRDKALGRLTDEEWRVLLDTEPPDRPVWQEGLFPDGGSAGSFPETFDGIPSGLFCRDLSDLLHPYEVAYEYWLWDGRPDRMDADRNGVPCETVYPAEEIEAYLGR